MRVRDHRLYHDSDAAYPFLESPNQGKTITPEYVVLHSTGGGPAGAVIGWLRNPQARASAHVLIARDGAITQLVPFDRAAWHAGQSMWAGRTGLNQFSLGIELENAGRLSRKNDSWLDWLGNVHSPDQVLERTHKFESAPSGWQRFTDVQIESLIGLLRLLIPHYQIKDVLGHEDVAPGRKTDPGPAFPMASVREAVLGPSVSAEPTEQLHLTRPLRLFYSYAHEDEDLREQLDGHLAILKRLKYIDDWHDRMIRAGDEWRGAIDDNLEQARIILLLVSPHFIESDFCWNIEMARALEKHDAGEAVVIPVILRPVDWQGAPFERLQALPKDARPITKWKNKDDAFYDVATGLRKKILAMFEKA